MTTTAASQSEINTNTSGFSQCDVASSGARVVVGNNGSGATETGNTATAFKQMHNTATNHIQHNNKNNNRGAETGKRKKIKSRNSALPFGGYSKEHLDAWLETCLKDASNTQLSSSSEFLDYNPTLPAVTKGAGAAHQFAQHQPSTLQQVYPVLANHQQKQQTPPFPAPMPRADASPQQQLPFGSRMQTQPQMAASAGYSAPFSQGMHHKQTHPFKNRYSLIFPSGSATGPGSSPFPHLAQSNGSLDFASLPPLVNMMGGGSSEHDHTNSIDIMNSGGSNHNISHGFSDPCLLNPSDNDSKVSGLQTPDQHRAVPNDTDNSKFFAALMDQINLLHETNSKICRNLHETKVDIEALKHVPNWGMRHRRDSASGLSTHSQPMIFGGGGFGTQSPAPTYHSGAYTPGMMTDLVREVKDAARVREDALLNRVKALVEERQWSMNEYNMRIMRDIEELKSQIHHLRVDRKDAHKRITNLEAENKYMRQMLATILSNNGNGSSIIYENETLRKPLAASRRTQSFNLQYGTIHHQPPSVTQLVEEAEQQHIADKAPMIASSTATFTGANTSRPSSKLRSSFSSSDGGCNAGMSTVGNDGGGGGDGDSVTVRSPSLSSVTRPLSNDRVEPTMSPPSFALVSKPVKPTAAQRYEHDVKGAAAPQASTELRQELSEAVAARQDADNRIIALEKLVKTLQVNATHQAEPAPFITNGVDKGGGSGNSRASPLFKWQPEQPKTIPMAPINATVVSPYGPIFNIEHHNRHHPEHTSNVQATNVAVAHTPPRLNVAGPITDL